MKKLSIALLLVFICFFCFADKIMMVQGGVTMSERSFKNDSGSKISHHFTSVGLNFINFIGGNIGFISIGGIFFPLNFTVNIDGSETKVSLDNYNLTKMIYEIFIGIGYNLQLMENTILLIGGGAHFNGILFSSSSYSGYDIYDYSSFVIGPEVNTTLYYKPNPALNLNISATVAYDIFEFLRLPALPEDVEYSGGIDIGIYAGIGFSF